MKTMIAVSVVAVMALTSGAQAGGLFSKKTTNILSNITGVAVGLTTRDINLLNGTTVAVGNNSNILSGIGNGNVVGNGLLNGVLNGSGNGLLGGNGILGLGGQNRGW